MNAAKKSELSRVCCYCFILTSLNLLTLNPAFLCFAWKTSIKAPSTRINATTAATKIKRSKETLDEGEVSPDPEVNINDNES